MAFEIGVQVYTYRDFDLPAVCRELATVGVTAIELMDTHLGPHASDEEIDAAVTALDRVDIDVRGYYGGTTENDDLGDIADRIAFASRLDADYVSCDFPNDDAIIDDVASLAEEYDVLIGIHNHGPGAQYQQVDDVIAVVEGAPPVIGACVDTGHFLRIDEYPDQVIPALGDRIHAVHVKDFADRDTEVVPEAGRLDLDELFALLESHVTKPLPLMIEYEADFADPSPAVRQTTQRLAEIVE